MPNRKVEVSKPEATQKALAMIADGQSYNRIEKTTGIDHRTLARLANENQESIDDWRRRAAQKAKQAADLVLDSLNDAVIERGRETSIKDLSISYGILADKSLVLSDQPTQITETRQAVDMDAARAAIEAAQKRICGEAIDV